MQIYLVRFTLKCPLIMAFPGLCWQTSKPITRTRLSPIRKKTTHYCMRSLPTWRLPAFTIHSTRFVNHVCCLTCNDLALFKCHISHSCIYASYRSTSLQSVSLTSPSSTSCLLLLSCLNYSIPKTKVRCFCFVFFH